MGTIADLVHFQMMKPLQGQSVPSVPVVKDDTLPDTRVSDQEAKTNIQPANSEIDQFFSTIGAHEYQYKDPSHGEKTYVSPMAQEIEKTVIGQSAVINDNGLKKVDYSRLIGASLSALSVHHAEIKNIKQSLEALQRAIPKARKSYGNT